MPTMNQQRSSIPVEVSGWDLDENFYVEQALLSRSPEGRERITLCSRLRIGSLLFLRMSPESSPNRAVPIPCEVIRLKPANSVGGSEAEIVRRHPREALRGDSYRSAAPPVFLN